MTKLQRMFAHVRESYVDRGLSVKEATARAAAVVNRYRAKLARGKRVCRKKNGRYVCRVKRGPKLVTRGGPRQQWWPGKKVRREKFVCLTHKRRFRTRSALLSHYRAGVVTVGGEDLVDALVTVR